MEVAPPIPAGPPVVIEGLTVRAAGRAIIDGARAEFPAGGLTLVVGSSGAGKSILLRLLAGLLGPGSGPLEVEGSIRIGQRELLGRRRGGPSPAGLVFQNFALFDELSAEENILFGLDHRRRDGDGAGRPDRQERREIPRRLLDSLGVPSGTKVALLSGGQKQRLAIARALAYDPDLIAYDEPTSGLDPATAARVAGLIDATRKAHGKTTVVVTHDWRQFEDLATRIFVLDGGKLREVPPRGLAALSVAAPAPAEGPPPAGPGPRRLARALRTLRAAAGLLGAVLAATGAAAEGLLNAAVGLLPRWRSPRWGLRYFRHALGLVASPTAWLYFGAAGLISGFVATYFTFKFLPFRAYTEPLLTEELLHGLGFALYRIVVPVLVTVLLAARCGAAVASDVGTRRYSQSIEAMESMGARPPAYLLTGILHAFVIGAPLLTLFAFGASRLASLLVFAAGYPQHGPFFWDVHFHRALRIPGALLFDGTGWLLLKVVLCGLGIGAIAYHQGLRPKHSAVDVSRGITGTIIASTLLVLAIHTAFAFLEFEPL